MTTLNTISDVVDLNHATGHHFFDDDTMEFFDSRIETVLMRGRFFVTSEKGPSGPRMFTVREAHDDGTIGGVGEGFMGYGTRDEAIEWIARNNG